jgi:hypothetical protein
MHATPGWRFVTAAALLCVAVATAGATLSLPGLWSTPATAGAAVARAPERTCPGAAHIGASERAADAVVELFLRTAVVRPARPGRSCLPPTLTVVRLAHPRYETRFPRRIAAWFQLAPRIKNAGGLWEYAGFLHVASPDAPPAAFQFLLELHGTRWLVSSFEVAPGSAEVEVGNAPT